MLDPKEKEAITAKYRPFAMAFCEKAIATHSGEDAMAERWQEVQDRYDEILDEAPDLGGNANMMARNFYEAAWVFALYETLERDMSREEIEALLAEVMAPHLRTLERLPGHFVARSRLALGLLSGYLKRYQAKVGEHRGGDWHNTWGMEVYDDVREGIHFGLRGCPINDWCREHDMMGLLLLLCNLDHVMLQAAHLYLVRPTTCSNDDEVCDYWCISDDSPEVARHPIRETAEGLMLN